MKRVLFGVLVLMAALTGCGAEADMPQCDSALVYEQECLDDGEPIYDEVAEHQDEVYRLMVKSGKAPQVRDVVSEVVESCADEVVYTIFHSKATLEAERRGTTVVDGWYVWADTLTEIEPDEDGFMPYEEYYFFDENNEMPEEITVEQKQDVAVVWDADAGKKLHDGYCSDDHSGGEAE